MNRLKVTKSFTYISRCFLSLLHLSLSQPRQRRHNIPVQPRLQRRVNDRRKQPTVIHRQILHQPPLRLRLIPLLRRSPAINKERIRPINRTGQNTEILAPGQLRHVRDVPVLAFGEVAAEGLFELLGQGVVVDG